MSDRKQAYNVMIPEKYIGSDKKERTNYYQVGTAWPTNSGEGYSVKLAPGVTVSGDLLILPRKPRSDAGSDTQLETDEVPF